MAQWIWLDLDGTIVDFYNVENWLDYLQQENEKPYKIAKPLYNCEELYTVLLNLKYNGYKLGIISWLSKECGIGFAHKITKAKCDWLSYYGLINLFDEILIVPYGEHKNNICSKYCTQGILIDDELNNRKQWNLGKTVDASRIDVLNYLKGVLQND